MDTKTTQDQIDAMREMARTLETNPLVRAAHIDDWGRFGNFTLMVTPQQHTAQTTTRLKALVKKSLPPGAMLRQFFSPDPCYERGYAGQKRLIGYSRTFWTFDIDYMHYDAQQNQFFDSN